MLEIREKGQEFNYYVKALLGYYDSNMQKLVLDSTEDIFNLMNISNKELLEISLKNINIGKFFIIKYNYDGNDIYCPIFTLEYRVVNNKNIIYAINFDYLPYDYKIKFVNILISKYIDQYYKHWDICDVREEKPFAGVTFENVYKILQYNGNYEYSITAFDILKIKNIYAVSTNLLYKFIFIHTRFVNIDNIKNRIKVEEDDINRTKLESILEGFAKIEKDYNNDVKGYYKKLKALELNYKLMK